MALGRGRCRIVGPDHHPSGRGGANHTLGAAAAVGVIARLHILQIWTGGREVRGRSATRLRWRPRRPWVVPVLCGALLAVAAPGAAAAAPGPVAPVLHATSAAVLDMRDGRILWQYNGRQRHPMASTTKLMTALVSLALEHQHTGVPMVVPPQVKQAYGEVLFLRPGDHYTYLQLLEGMLLPSANDAAIAVAVDSAGSQRRFVALMNRAAVAYGLPDTHYANPNGLDAPDHFSSADDLARLGWIAMHNPIIRHLVSLRSATIPSPLHGSELIGNINALLSSFPGATGIKTGYTSQAMNVIVGSATVHGRSVIAVLMGEPAAPFWRDESRLLRFGLALEAARGPVAPVAPPVFRLPGAGFTRGPAARASSARGAPPAAFVPGSGEIASVVVPSGRASAPSPAPSAAGLRPRGGRSGGRLGWAGAAAGVVVGLLLLLRRGARRRSLRRLSPYARGRASLGAD